MEPRLEQLAILSFFVLPVLLFVFDLVNLDFGFHLKADEFIWLERAIPRHDMFSYLAEGNRWVDSHWLFQLLLYRVSSGGGIAGTILLRVAILPRKGPDAPGRGMVVRAVLSGGRENAA